MCVDFSWPLFCDYTHNCKKSTQIFHSYVLYEMIHFKLIISLLSLTAKDVYLQGVAGVAMSSINNKVW